MIRVDMTWYCPSCKRPGKLVPPSLGDPAFWICVNTNCGNQNTAPAAERDSDTPGWVRAIAALDRVAELVGGGRTVRDACEQVKMELRRAATPEGP